MICKEHQLFRINDTSMSVVRFNTMKTGFTQNEWTNDVVDEVHMLSHDVENDVTDKSISCLAT